jgi:hypothetical protein
MFLASLKAMVKPTDLDPPKLCYKLKETDPLAPNATVSKEDVQIKATGFDKPIPAQNQAQGPDKPTEVPYKGTVIMEGRWLVNLWTALLSNLEEEAAGLDDDEGQPETAPRPELMLTNKINEPNHICSMVNDCLLLYRLRQRRGQPNRLHRVQDQCQRRGHLATATQQDQSHWLQDQHGTHAAFRSFWRTEEGLRYYHCLLYHPGGGDNAYLGAVFKVPEVVQAYGDLHLWFGVEKQSSLSNNDGKDTYTEDVLHDH